MSKFLPLMLVLCASTTSAEVPGFDVQLDLEEMVPQAAAQVTQATCQIAATKPALVVVEKAKPVTVTELEGRILRQALQCNRGNPALRVPTEQLLVFLRMEEEFGVPHSMRGLVLAAACSESGMQAAAVGDGSKAVGFLQMWRWWERAYKIDRENPHQAVRAWLTHTRNQSEIARRKCRVSTTESWRIAEARTSRGAIGKGYVRQLGKLPLSERARLLVKYGKDVRNISRKDAVRIGRRELPRKAIEYAERCHDLTGHVKRLRRWQRRSQRQKEQSSL